MNIKPVQVATHLKVNSTSDTQDHTRRDKEEKGKRRKRPTLVAGSDYQTIAEEVHESLDGTTPPNTDLNRQIFDSEKVLELLMLKPRTALSALKAFVAKSLRPEEEKPELLTSLNRKL